MDTPTDHNTDTRTYIVTTADERGAAARSAGARATRDGLNVLDVVSVAPRRDGTWVVELRVKS